MAIFTITGALYSDVTHVTIVVDPYDLVNEPNPTDFTMIQENLRITITIEFLFDPLVTDATISKIVIHDAITDELILILDGSGASATSDPLLTFSIRTSTIGADIMTGGTANDRLYAWDGDDQLFGNGGTDILIGAAGNDSISGGNGVDTLYGDAGNDTLAGEGDDDTIRGGSGDDAIIGGADDDLLYGEGGKDNVVGGLGNDRAYGGGADDRLGGDAGNDILLGDAGNDRLSGGEHTDRVYGGDGDDILLGGSGNDTLYGEAGVDRLYTGDGNDIALGGAGADSVHGEAGSDRLYGGADGDTMLGGAGNDRLFGEGGADRLIGEDGNDRLSGGLGNDVLLGGLGADVFVFADDTEGNDRIDDWLGPSDQIEIDASAFGGGLVAGVLAANRLVVGTAPVADQAFGQFLYSTTNGQLSWDADGTGALAAIAITRLLNGGVAAGTLAVADFEVVA